MISKLFVGNSKFGQAQVDSDLAVHLQVEALLVDTELFSGSTDDKIDRFRNDSELCAQKLHLLREDPGCLCLLCVRMCACECTRALTH